MNCHCYMYMYMYMYVLKIPLKNPLLPTMHLPLSFRSLLSFPLLSCFTSLPALNTGLVLWLQKYRAMLVKRMYIFSRFWQAMFTQLVLPLFCVSYAMVLAKTILFFDDASDPKRRLGVSDCSLGANQTFFWTEFGDGVVNSSDSSFFDFTDQVIHHKQNMCMYIHIQTLSSKCIHVKCFH